MTDYTPDEAILCITTAEICTRRIMKRLKAKAYDRHSAVLRHLIERDEKTLLFLKELKGLYENCEELKTEPSRETEEFSRRINGGNYE